MLKSTITLRPYQQEIVEKILESKAKEGQIILSTGSGKSIIAIEILVRLGLTSTILVPNTVLLDQFVAEIKKFTGYDAGVIGDGQKVIRSITVSTFQSLQSDPDLCSSLANSTSVLFVDELQGAVTDLKIKVLECFKPTYMFGLSATPMRDDGKTPVCGFVFGPELCHYEGTQMMPAVEIVQCREPIVVEEYPDMIRCLTENENRNTLIMGVMVGEIMQNRKVLALTKRREHAKTLYNMLNAQWHGGVAHLIDSDDKDRNELLGKFKRNEKDFRLIIGTTSLLSVGMDIPVLDTLVLACDMKSECLTVQSCGRILRILDNKNNPKIIDIVDRANPILYRQAKARISFYKSRNWQITGI